MISFLSAIGTITIFIFGIGFISHIGLNIFSRFEKYKHLSE
jgi:cbb3-type cytochrome oxidase subunit 3